MGSARRFLGIVMSRKMMLFNWSDKLVAAYSLSGAARLIRERFETTRGAKIVPVTGKVSYCDEGGEELGKVNATDCGRVWPVPMILPEASAVG